YKKFNEDKDTDCGLSFKVKWQDYDNPEDDTWELESEYRGQNLSRPLFPFECACSPVRAGEPTAGRHCRGLSHFKTLISTLNRGCFLPNLLLIDCGGLRKYSS